MFFFFVYLFIAGCPCSSQTDCYGYCDNNSKLSPSYTCQNAIQPGGFCKGLEVNNECSGDYYCYLGSHTCQRCLGGGAFCTRDAECSTRNCIGSTQLFNGTYTTGQCSNPSDLGKAIATIVLIAIIVPCVIVFLCICIPLTIWCCRRSRVGPVISPVQQPLIYQVTSPNQPVFIAGQQPYQVLP